MNEIFCTLEKEGFNACYHPGTRGGTYAVIYAVPEGSYDKPDYLRDANFNVLVLNMLRQRGRISVDRVQQAMHWLKAQYGIDRIAVTGASLGGQYALLAASLIPGIGCVVAITPFDYICEEQRYTRHGLDLPYTPLREQAEYNEMSRIPYQNMKSDILLLGARDSELWSSIEAVSRIKDRLQKINYPYRMETYICDRSAQIMDSRERIIQFLDTWAEN